MIVLMVIWVIKMLTQINKAIRIKELRQDKEIQQMVQAHKLNRLVQTIHQDLFILQQICINNNKINNKLAAHTNKIQQEEWVTDNQ